MSVVKPDNWRDLVVAEARTWVGTPYHTMADVKGAGVDCAMIIVKIYVGLGLAPPFDPRPYPAQWFLHRDEERYLGWMEKYARRTETPGPGDLAMYRFGRTASHGAIIVDDEMMIHAYQPSGRVEIVERRAFIERLDSYWSPA